MNAFSDSLFLDQFFHLSRTLRLAIAEKRAGVITIDNDIENLESHWLCLQHLRTERPPTSRPTSLQQFNAVINSE